MSIAPNYNECKHEHIHIDVIGSITFSGGEIIDTQKEVTTCMDCWHVIEPVVPAEAMIDFDIPF